MSRLENIRILNSLLLEEAPEYRQQAERFAEDMGSQRRLLRSLMNVRYPGKRLNPEFLRLQDELLAEEREEKGVVDVLELPAVNSDSRISLWQGDITCLKADAIVNAANSQMLGCFIPCHACIDNAIHSAAGLQLRDECMELMQAQGHEEPVGRAKITKGYNLPAKFVLHTVGPAVSGTVTQEDEKKLESCYRSCLELAEANGIRSIVFCCISTGVFCFPNGRAAEIAIQTVREYLKGSHIQRVVFNVFQDHDKSIYEHLLKCKA
ncbi:MAG: protein-ADP-ribose hydrolase [Lachnospiraceae bacterium]|nr:protein-ADP-ribose hydrolase [Lachnospiraceae bacterium]